MHGARFFCAESACEGSGVVVSPSCTNFPFFPFSKIKFKFPNPNPRTWYFPSCKTSHRISENDEFPFVSRNGRKRAQRLFRQPDCAETWGNRHRTPVPVCNRGGARNESGEILRAETSFIIYIENENKRKKQTSSCLRVTYMFFARTPLPSGALLRVNCSRGLFFSVFRTEVGKVPDRLGCPKRHCGFFGAIIHAWGSHVTPHPPPGGGKHIPSTPHDQRPRDARGGRRRKQVRPVPYARGGKWGVSMAPYMGCRGTEIADRAVRGPGGCYGHAGRAGACCSDARTVPVAMDIPVSGDAENLTQQPVGLNSAFKPESGDEKHDPR